MKKTGLLIIVLGLVFFTNALQGADYDTTGQESKRMPWLLLLLFDDASGSDNTAPSTLTGLSASAVSSSQINLQWNASNDNVGVTGYKIYRGGVYPPLPPLYVYLKSVAGTSATDPGLSPSANYCYQVSAYDAAGNESAKSASSCATTESDTQSYTFNGGTIDQLRAVSPTLEFADLTINGPLQIPETESNVTLDVNNLYLNSFISIDHPTCKPFTSSPNLNINASGDVRIGGGGISLRGHHGDRLDEPPNPSDCNDCSGEDGGNLTVNAANIYVNKGIATHGGTGLDYYTGINSGFPYDIDIRYGCDGGDGGNITLNASGILSIGPEAADFGLDGGSSGSGSPAYVGGVSGTDGNEGVLSWNGATITVAEDPGSSSGELNMYIANAQLLDYKKMTLNGRVGKNEESDHRDPSRAACINFTPGVCGDWVEDFFLLELKHASTIKLSLSPADSRADLDLYLINQAVTNIIAESNGPGGNESFTSLLLDPGRYLVGVSFADDDPDYITTNYTLKFKQ